jgi:phage terminase large subunit-like protein
MRDREFRLFGPARVFAPPAEGSVDARDLERALIEMHAETPIDTVVMDASNNEQMAQWIERELHVRVVERQQTLTLMALDYSRFMEALREGWLHHAGDQDFARHVLNAVARVLPRGDIVFERPSGSRTNTRQQRLRVVDALDAAAMVHSAAVAELDAPVSSPMVAFA